MEYSLLQPENGKPEIRLDQRVILNFSEYPYRYFHQDGAIIAFESISFQLIFSISQIRFDWDRTENVDFALVVENYITTQRNFASKRKNEDKVTLSEPIQPHTNDDRNEILKENGRIMKAMLEHYVALDNRPDIVPIKLPDQTVTIQDPANQGQTPT